jgi:hypothetical protein
VSNRCLAENDQLARVVQQILCENTSRKSHLPSYTEEQESISEELCLSEEEFCGFDADSLLS